MITKRLNRKKKTQLTEEVFPSEKGSHNGSTSSKDLQGCPNLLRLAHDLRTNHLKGGPMRNQRFLPNNQLEELVTKKSVLLVLQETTIEQQYHEDLASWVLQNSMRLFLILVLLTRGSTERLSCLQKFKDDGVNDRALPLGFSENESTYGYSKAAHLEEGVQKFYSFINWEDNDLILFDSYQWMFLAPVLGASNKFRHQLYSGQPLPLVNLSQKPTKGILGETLSGEIHPAHLDSQCLSELGAVNDPDFHGIPVFIKLVQPSDKLSRFFDINTGKFKATHPIISPSRIHPIAAYQKNGDDFVVFRWVCGDNSSI
ncbi:hypothetical protein GQX73_g6845 [Xylaria multiplex]|uniref:Uncharacterized protein n=1 Tax=Xylaria multiplex TaxID=323545 RepID=A0A7C8MVT3_9PEZI|nr:hypothetical protein GQX73_g6845 [Xylaria multiplex]